ISVSSVSGAVANVKYNGSATVPTNAATYAVTADFVPTDTTNYNTLSALSAGNFTIDKATPTATLAVSNSPQTYTGSPLSAAVAISASSVSGAVANVKYNGLATVPTNAATYAVTADFVPTDTTNYNTLPALSAGNFTIDKATPTATLAVSNSPQTYTGSPLSATVAISVSSVSGAVANVKYNGSATVPTNAATYAVTADFVPTDTTNYNTLPALSAGDFTIDKATSTTTTVGDGPFVYDGTTHNGGSGTVTGAGGLNTVATSLTYTGDQVNAGTYYVTAHYAGDANHLESDGVAVAITIGKATSTTTTGGAGPFVYDGMAHNGGSGTVTGAGGLNTSATSLTYTGDQVNAGTYYVTAHYAGDANHFGSDGAAVAIIIAKANATVVVTPYNVQWDGNPHTATHAITGVNGETGATVGTVTLNTTHTAIGTYSTDSWSFTPTANYNAVAGATITDVIATAYCFNGFLSPIGGSVETSNGGSFTDPVRSFKLGSTIPIKFILNARNGSTCGAVVTSGIHTLQVTFYSSATDADSPIDATPTDTATTGNQFRLTSPEWHFNLSTKGAGFKTGTWQLKATLQDGSVYTVWISIKK
ncbi:MAG TPA: PxKF domain-containing protein, partial [Vicinamibacterales bacterium]|nr:PxKF domain-containing protein [Vicinamibacterales bacterium]